MALDKVGRTYLDPRNGNGMMRRGRMGAPGSRMGSALQVIALQLPRMLGRNALAPAPILRGAGGPVAPSALASGGDRGPRMSGIAEAVATGVLGEFLSRPGMPGVGGGAGDIISRLSAGSGGSPTPAPSITMEGGPVAGGTSGPPVSVTTQHPPDGPVPLPTFDPAPEPSLTMENFYDSFDQSGYQDYQASNPSSPISPYEYVSGERFDYPEWDGGWGGYEY